MTTGPLRLGMMPRPEGYEFLKEEIRQLKVQGTDVLVCLLEKPEQQALGLEAEGAVCALNGMEFIHFPMPDFGVPTDEMKFVALAGKLRGYLEHQKTVVVHCHGGIGRSSLLVAGILVNRGLPPGDVFTLISHCRGEKTPESMAQEQWFYKVFNGLRPLKTL